MSKRLMRTVAVAAAMAGVGGTTQAAIDFTGQEYFTFGNTNVYEMPALAYRYNKFNGGGEGPGNPYYIASTPGAIKDLAVIYTGSNGGGVTTNVAGFDDVYGTPNGTVDYASISQNVGVINPGNKAGIANNDAATWDANLLALKGLLNGGDAIFLFNNNDTNKDINLAIWAKLWLTDGTGAVYNNRYLYLSNQGAAYGMGGTVGGDAGAYNPGNVLPAGGNLAATDYVLSGGHICVSTTTGLQVAPTPSGCPSGSDRLEMNLGANQVAYAGSVPLLNDWLKTLFALGDTALNGYTMHLDLRLGCDAAVWGTGKTDCDNIKIDNGFEQLFLASTASDFLLPEPGALTLAGLALLAAWGARRRQLRG